MAAEAATVTALDTKAAPPSPVAETPAAKTAPATAAAPSADKKPTVAELIAQRAEQLKLKTATPPEPPKAGAAPATPAGAAEPKEKAPEAAPANDGWGPLWKAEGDRIATALRADPKFKALAALGLVEKVPDRMLAHYQEKKEHLTETQAAEELLSGVKAEFRGFLSHPELKDIFEELWTELHPAGAPAADATAAPAEAPKADAAPNADPDSPKPGETRAKFLARKGGSPPTLSNRLPAAAAAVASPPPDDEAKKPKKGETRAQYLARVRDAGVSP